MRIAARGVLLDTYTIIRWANGLALRSPGKEAIDAHRGALLISPISAWEIGLLSKPERPQPMLFMPDPHTWFARVASETGVRLVELTWEMAVDSSHLPQPIHGDPADRLLIATARALDLALVTSDARILDYGRAGHVTAIAC